MNWFVVALGMNMAALAGAAASGVAGARRRRETVVDWAMVEDPGTLPSWGLPMACGIDAVNGEGQVVGTVLVRAPMMN
jgi:hypothetical protein